jgi:hypothetical protein
MKTRSVRFIWMATAMLSAGLFASCDKDDDATPADKTELVAAVTVATALHDGAVEGPAAGQYQVGAKAAFKISIDEAQGVVDNSATTQIQVTNSLAALASATTLFQTKIVEEIDPASLVGYWKFDEGAGVAAADASGNAHAGVLMAGSAYAGGGEVPTWSADRKGVAAKALHFTKGGHIEVPSNVAFNPTEITIALWVNIDSLNTAACGAFGSRCNGGVYFDNYMISQNYWDGYKLQTQEAKKLFGTVHAISNIWDKDTENSPATIKLKTWTHVAMTYKAGEMNFYVNGVMVKSWTDTQGAIKVIADRFDFLIGQELPNAKIINDPGYIINHFEGYMDEIRIYKKVLTAAQVTAIYDQEKV